MRVYAISKVKIFFYKACSINPRSVEGLLLKGSLLLELKKLQEAVMHFREAMQIAPHRFEPHKVGISSLLTNFNHK